MNTDFLKDLNEKTKATLEPVTKFNELLSKSVQDVFKLQMDSSKKYSEFVMDQFKSMQSIKDTESLQDFFKEQMDSFTQLNEQMMQDLKALGDTGLKFRDEVQAIMHPVIPSSEDKSEDHPDNEEKPKAASSFSGKPQSSSKPKSSGKSK